MQIKAVFPICLRGLFLQAGSRAVCEHRPMRKHPKTSLVHGGGSCPPCPAWCEDSRVSSGAARDGCATQIWQISKRNPRQHHFPQRQHSCFLDHEPDLSISGLRIGSKRRAQNSSSEVLKPLLNLFSTTKTEARLLTLSQRRRTFCFASLRSGLFWCLCAFGVRCPAIWPRPKACSV